MKNVGVIDIGSNSIRLVIIETGNQNYFRIIDDVKETVRLGMDIMPDGSLNPLRMKTAISTLANFKWLCDSQEIETLIVVATEAIRRASNQQEFLKLVQNQLGINIRVLTGAEEAYYDYFGVINSMDISNGLIMDIGGSSTELVLFKHRRAVEVISLPFGAINLSNQFNLMGKMNIAAENDLNKFLMSQFEKVTWLAGIQNIPLIGVGGTVRNIGKISRKNSNYPIDRHHHYQIPSNEVLDIYTMIKDKTLEQRKKVKGLAKERSDIFLGAISVAAALIRYCSISELIVSGSGLREGLIYETLLGQTTLNSVLDFSLNILAQTLNIDLVHAQHVWKLAESLYLQLKPLHQFSYHADKILKTAAILNDCGKIVSFYNYYKHTFFMILNLPINGLTHKELIMTAYTMILSVKDKYDLDGSPYIQLLNEREKHCVQKLGILLRLAECFDRRKKGYISNAVCTENSETVLIQLVSNDPTDGERKLAEECKESFLKLFGKTLQIE
jgi:exopolyphosphatase/guanosine-5'-triphosphate,3'-diphosphate pyrophosphatase